MGSKSSAKDATLSLPGIPRPVGRPKSGNAKTPAERMRAYRERRKAQESEFPSRVTQIDESEIPY